MIILGIIIILVTLFIVLLFGLETNLEWGMAISMVTIGSIMIVLGIVI